MEKNNLPISLIANLQRKLDISAKLSINPERSRRVDFFIEFILILILAITPFLLGSVGPFGVTIVELGAFLVLFLWVLKLIGEGSIDFVHLPINKFIILFLAFVLIQYILIDFFIYEFPLGAIYKQKIKKEALEFISYLIFFYIVLNNFQGRGRINRLISSLISIGFILSFFGIIQKLSGAKNIFWIMQPQGGEVFFASFPNRNHFANYINMTIFLTFGVMFSRFPILRSDIHLGLDKKAILRGIFATFEKGIWLYMIALIVMVSSLFYSLSRGGQFSFVCGLVFFSVLVLVKGLTKRGYIFLFTILVFTFMMLIWINAPAQIIQKFSKIDNAKAPLIERMWGGRKIFADKAIELIKGYPLLGVGFGAFEFVYNKKYNPKILYVDRYYYIDHLHNDFLELFCGVGLIGFIIFGIAAFSYIFFLTKTLLERRDPFTIGAGIGIMAGLFSMCIHSLLDFNFHITSNALLFFVMTALAVVASNSQIRDKKEATLLLRTRPLVVRKSFNKVLALFIVTAIFFYAAKLVANPYLAYRLSKAEGTNMGYLKKAIRLDPLNDRYHFMLAEFFIEQIRSNKDKMDEYIALAQNEVKEAIRLNPWNEYYPIYLEWVVSTFKQ